MECKKYRFTNTAEFQYNEFCTRFQTRIYNKTVKINMFEVKSTRSLDIAS